MGTTMSCTDSCRQCCRCCCYPCIHCCCKDSTEKPIKYPHVQYKSPEEAKVPLDKIFEFQQPQSDYVVHPQMTHVISEQPRVIQRGGTPEASERSSSSVSTTAETIPTLQFSLYYDIQRRSLSVHLQQAYNLPAKDIRGTSDPFVVFFLLPNKEEIYESKIVHKTLNPIFDQVFEFGGILPQEIRRQTIMFRVYDHDRFTPNELIGVVALSLEEADLYGVSMKMRIDEKEEFRSDSKGDLLFSLTYQPANSTIQGILLKATNLQKQDITGTADPYVKVYILHKGKKHDKWKSTVKRNTLLPIFNEPFQFEISNLNVLDLSLEFYIMDYDRFSSDDVVGQVLVGPNAKEEMGRTHWEELISNPNQPISRWHAIYPTSKDV